MKLVQIRKLGNWVFSRRNWNSLGWEFTLVYSGRFGFPLWKIGCETQTEENKNERKKKQKKMRKRTFVY